MSQYKVIKKYLPDENLFVKIDKNEEVQIIGEYNSITWKNWVECIYMNKKCYIPKQYLEIKKNYAILNRFYNSTELTVYSGMLFYAELVLNGWAYGKLLKSNIVGWLPLDILLLSE